MPELYRDKFPGRLGAAGARVMMMEERISAWWADLVLAVHEPHRERLARSGIAPEKIKVVMNTPDNRYFKPDPRVHRDSSAFTLVCHGTITHRMGLDLVVRAVAALRDRIPELRLIAIGAGDHLPEIRRLVDDLKLNDRVTFRGLMPIEELPGALGEADCGVVPNRASSATHLMLPVKLLDYAMLGIPAISSRLRTVEYYFGDRAVRFFNPDDVDDLCAAIEHLYRSPELRTELARNASKVIDLIEWHNQREEFYRAIDSLLPGGAIRIHGDREREVASARLEGYK
jgi:glycosyltransferase involved in cell wall biosynthesis